MRFQCSFCFSIINKVKSEQLGQKIDCPNCRRQQVLPVSPFGPGRIIGDFAIIQKIGEGSIGTVYLAKQISLDRNVALKILSEKYTNAKGLASFLSEARTAAKLNHPNIVQVYAVGDEGGICFMAMSFIQGKTVKQRIEEEGKIEVDEALHITQQVAEGLFFAWEEEKLIHRDIKPENIIITPEGAAKLTDLGLAISQDKCEKGMEISGTPYYMSPEQFAGEKLDSRTDIYSLGITLYQMLCGKLPYKGDSLNTVAKQHFYEKPEPLKKLDASIPLDVENLVNKMIAKHPDDRFQSLEELLKEIWRIRQKTAPSKEMVPGVHTISIKKLDYKSIQEQSKSARQEGLPLQQPSVSTEKKICVNKVLIALLLLSFLLIILLLTALLGQRAKKLDILESQIEKIESKIHITDPPPYNEIETECQELLNKIKSPVTEADKAVVFRLKLILSLLDEKKLQAETKKLSDRIQELEKQKLNETEKLKLEYENKLASKDAEIAKVSQETKVLQQKFLDEKKGLEKIIADYQKKIDEEKKKADEKVRNLLLSKYYALIRQFKFVEALAAVKEYRLKTDGDTKELESLEEKTNRLSKFYELFTSSGNKLTNTKTPEGIIINISEKKILMNADGNFVGKRWDQLSLDTLAAVILKLYPDENDKKLRSEISLLLGNPAQALKETPDDYVLKSMIQAAFHANYDSIKSLAETNKKKAQQRFLLFQKEFEGIPDCAEGIQSLKSYLADSPTPATPASTPTPLGH